MRFPTRGRKICRSAAAIAAIAVSLVLMACPDSRPPANTLPAGNDPASRAIRYLATSDPADDPTVSLILVYLERRFGIRAFSNAIKYGSDLAAEPSEGLHRYERIFTPDAKLGAFESAAAAGISTRQMALLEYLPLVALHCDRWPLPADFFDLVRSETLRGGYFATHAAVAVQWAAEQRCVTLNKTGVLGSALRDELSKTASAMGGDDLFVEALAMLYYLDQGDVVETSWIDTLKRSQMADGSFPFGSEPSDPRHSTALGLWALLASEGRGNPATTWIPDPGPPATDMRQG